ncbi:ERAP1-like C-terminal domain-containing protein [Thalassotalea sp. PS06]|uniref:ERAP1-like C-terminal domain-containing protein n=1 Tax=Thalassotalea sp. PS06 TaxID=2594005 RepID=UPI001C8F5EF3|nr:ERAP1-like C-terminal domain-containing protein [Thalassotalea sp. PS06]
MSYALASAGHEDLLKQSSFKQANAISDSRKALDKGHKTINDHLILIESLSASEHIATAQVIVDEVISIGYVYLDDRNLIAYAYFVNSVLEPWLSKVGLKEVAGQPYETVYLRARLLRALAQFGRNKQITSYLQSLAPIYLQGDSGISVELGTEALRISAINANRNQQDLVHRYFKVADSTSNPQLRKSIVQAMYFSDSTAIHYIFKQSPKAGFSSGERMYILQRLFWQNKEQAILYQWLEDDFSKWVANLPLLYQSVLPEVFTPSCQWDNAQSLYDFFSDKRSIFQTSLQKQLSKTAQCLQVKQLQKPLLNDFLASYN